MNIEKRYTESSYYDGNVEHSFFLVINGIRYRVSEEEYDSSEDWTEGDIKDFLKRESI